MGPACPDILRAVPAGGVCVGICTSARSNVEDAAENPLTWTLAGLAAQDAPIAEVLILKHGDSSPAFDSVVQQFRPRLPIEVEGIDRAAPLGKLRNHLLQAAGDRLLYIIDDDAIPATTRTLSTQVERFTAAEGALAVLQAPVLRRTLTPRRVTREGLRVGAVEPETGDLTFAFDSVVPSESGEPPLVEIDHLCLAQSLLDPARVRDIGGFTTFPWPAVYGQESELGVRLVDSGQRVCFLPDPAAAVVHLKFGAPHWNAPPPGVDGVLPGGVDYSQAAALAGSRAETGHESWSRKSSAGFFADYVSGFGAVFARRGAEGLERFLANTAQRFVADNRLHHPFVTPIECAAERAEAFRVGVERLVRAGMWRGTTDFTVRPSCESGVPGKLETVWI